MDAPQLNYFHICDQVIIAQDSNNVSLINIFNEIQTSGLPAIHPRFSILSNTAGPKGSYIQEIEVIGPDGASLAKISGEANYSGIGPNNFIANFVNFVFPQAGEYIFRVKVGGGILSEKASIITVKSI